MTPAQKAAARLGAKRRALLQAARKSRAPIRRSRWEEREIVDFQMRQAMGDKYDEACCRERSGMEWLSRMAFWLKPETP